MSTATEFVKRELIDQRIRVIISDGRVVEGELLCLDRGKNMVLCDAVEYYIDPEEPIVGE
jgi:small nuclear ribonucleoprotein (snRNP)-like protein